MNDKIPGLECPFKPEMACIEKYCAIWDKFANCCAIISLVRK